MRDNVRKLIRRVIEQFVDDIGIIHLQVAALANGFGGDDRAALDFAAGARLCDFVAHAQLMNDIDGGNAIAGVGFFLRAVSRDGRDQNKIRAQILRQPERRSVVTQRLIQLGRFRGDRNLCRA